MVLITRRCGRIEHSATHHQALRRRVRIKLQAHSAMQRGPNRFAELLVQHAISGKSWKSCERNGGGAGNRVDECRECE